jgi:hypothetical protein
MQAGHPPVSARGPERRRTVIGACLKTPGKSGFEPAIKRVGQEPGARAPSRRILPVATQVCNNVGMTRRTHYDAPAETGEAYDRSKRSNAHTECGSFVAPLVLHHSYFTGTFIPDKYTSIIRFDSLEFKQLGRRIDSFRMQVWIESASIDRFAVRCLRVRSLHF